jgi:DNA-binding transcriptional regulator YiaG
MGEFALRVADAYCETHGLLTSSQMKDRRRNLGMSQQQFAKYLGVGSSSVKRWELGWIQDKAMNDLILLRTDPRAAEANLAEVLARLGKPLGKSKIHRAPTFRTLGPASIKGSCEDVAARSLKT